MRLLNRALMVLATLLASAVVQAATNPVYIGFDAELGHKTSTSDEAIKAGIEIAIDEINAKGGVLGGRPLKLIEKDNRSVPARGVENIKQFAATDDLVAVFCGKFSPVALEVLPLIHELKLPLLDPWAAADGIIDHDYSPSYSFRLSLKDSWAIQKMLAHVHSRGLNRVGVLLPNTAWGRSSLAALEKAVAADGKAKLVATQWYNWGDTTLLPQYQAIAMADANVLMLVANEKEGALLVKEIATLPRDRRLPVVSHWGVTGGDLAGMAGPAMKDVDFSVVQTYSFVGRQDAKARQVAEAAMKRLGKANIRQLLSPVGVAHAYDLTHILALAIDKAGGTDRVKVRAALEQVKGYKGLIKTYARPFAAGNHEALTLSDVIMAHYEGEGAPVPMVTGKTGK